MQKPFVGKLRVFPKSLNVAVKKTPPLTVGLGPSQVSTRACERVSLARLSGPRGFAVDRPPRYGEKNAPGYRRARACPSPSFARWKKRLLFSSGP